jgi:hypothetical protein
MYDQLFSILAALIIGQCIFFLIAFVIMMLAAAKLAPLPWILYDVEDYEHEKEEKRARARSHRNTGLSASGQRSLAELTLQINSTSQLHSNNNLEDL